MKSTSGSERRRPGSIEDEGIELHGIPEERAHGNPEKIVLDLELSQVIQEVLNALAPKLREVFVMGVIQEMSYEEVAGIVGRSVSSVKTDVYRARMQIKDDLRRYMPGRLNATRRDAGTISGLMENHVSQEQISALVDQAVIGP